MSRRENAHVNVISTADGESRELVTFDKKTRLGRDNSVTWTADGKYILFSVYDPSSENNIYELCRIPADGGDLEKLGLKVKNGFINMSAHPDGRHFAYSTRGQRTMEMWVMENFLPQTGAK
jgi:Tol biopolymer transport system component